MLLLYSHWKFLISWIIYYSKQSWPTIILCSGFLMLILIFLIYIAQKKICLSYLRIEREENYYFEWWSVFERIRATGMRTKTAIIKIHPWNGRRKIISSRTKTGWLVNPCRHLSQHANSRLEWLAGTIAQGLLVRATCYSSGHDHVCTTCMHVCRERKRLEPPHCRAPSPLDSRVLHVTATLNGYRATIRRRAVSWLGILVTFHIVKKDACVAARQVLLMSNSSSPSSSKRKSGTISRCNSPTRFVRWYLFARCFCVYANLF